MISRSRVSVSTKTSSPTELARSYGSRSNGRPGPPTGRTCLGVDRRDRVRVRARGGRWEAGGNVVVGDVTRARARRASALGGALARKPPGAMGRVTAIGVDHDLASSQAGICHRSTDDETARGIDESAYAAVFQLGWDHGIEDVLADVRGQLLGGDRFVMLGGEEDRVDRRLLTSM